MTCWPHQWAAMGIILAGVAWVVFEEPEISEITEINGEPVIPGHRGLGMALAVCAAVTQAIGMVFSKMGIGQYDIMAATQIRPLAALMPCYLAVVALARRWRRGFCHRAQTPPSWLPCALGRFLARRSAYR